MSLESQPWSANPNYHRQLFPKTDSNWLMHSSREESDCHPEIVRFAAWQIIPHVARKFPY